jgi:hypothetical protein
MKKRGVLQYTEFIGVRLDKELLQNLVRISEVEDRPLASLIRIALREWIAAREKGTKKKPKT